MFSLMECFESFRAVGHTGCLHLKRVKVRSIFQIISVKKQQWLNHYLEGSDQRFPEVVEPSM